MLRHFRWSSILLIATSTGDLSPFAGCFQYFIRNSLWVVFLHYSFGLQRWVNRSHHWEPFCLFYHISCVVMVLYIHLYFSTSILINTLYTSIFSTSSTSIPIQYRSISVSDSGRNGSLCFQFCWISFWARMECIENNCIHLLWELVTSFVGMGRRILFVNFEN